MKHLGRLLVFLLDHKGHWYVFGLFLVILAASGAGNRTAHILIGESYYFGTDLPDWAAAVPVLQPLVKRGRCSDNHQLPAHPVLPEALRLHVQPQRCPRRGRRGMGHRPAFGKAPHQRTRLPAVPHRGTPQRHPHRRSTRMANQIPDHQRSSGLPGTNDSPGRPAPREPDVRTKVARIYLISIVSAGSLVWLYYLVKISFSA